MPIPFSKEGAASARRVLGLDNNGQKPSAISTVGEETSPAVTPGTLGGEGSSAPAGTVSAAPASESAPAPSEPATVSPTQAVVEGANESQVRSDAPQQTEGYISSRAKREADLIEEAEQWPNHGEAHIIHGGFRGRKRYVVDASGFFFYRGDIPVNDERRWIGVGWISSDGTHIFNPADSEHPAKLRKPIPVSRAVRKNWEKLQQEVQGGLQARPSAAGAVEAEQTSAPIIDRREREAIERHVREIERALNESDPLMAQQAILRFYQRYDPAYRPPFDMPFFGAKKKWENWWREIKPELESEYRAFIQDRQDCQQQGIDFHQWLTNALQAYVIKRQSRSGDNQNEPPVWGPNYQHPDATQPGQSQLPPIPSGPTQPLSPTAAEATQPMRAEETLAMTIPIIPENYALTSEAIASVATASAGDETSLASIQDPRYPDDPNKKITLTHTMASVVIDAGRGSDREKLQRDLQTMIADDIKKLLELPSTTDNNCTAAKEIVSMFMTEHYTDEEFIAKMQEWLSRPEQADRLAELTSKVAGLITAYALVKHYISPTEASPATGIA